MHPLPPRFHWLLYLTLLSISAGLWIWASEPDRVFDAFRAKTNITWGVVQPKGGAVMSVVTNGSHISIRRDNATEENQLTSVLDGFASGIRLPARDLGYPRPLECYCGAENFCAEPMIHSKVGKAFDCSLLPYLHQFGLTDNHNVTERKTPLDQIVFVSAASSNHFKLARSWIRSLRQRHPNAPVVLWDLGLKPAEKAEASEWCGVMVREFPYADYPPHFRNKFNYAWKVVIKAVSPNFPPPKIQIHFKEGDFFVWEDASVRVKPNYNFTRILNEITNHRIESTFPPHEVYHSIFATTAPGFYEYFPMHERIAKHWYMKAATLQFVLPNDYTRRMLKWELLCALTPDCIAPKDHKLDCEFVAGDRMTKYAGCHRYDQSLMNAMIVRLLANDLKAAKRFGYTNSSVFTSTDEVLRLGSKRRQKLRPLEMFNVNRHDLEVKPVVMSCPA